MASPLLFTFTVSHYGEKARWALDYLGIDYQIRYLAPGPHVLFAKKLKLPETAVPILINDEGAIQGSSRIIDWAESHSEEGAKTLSPKENQDQWVSIEQRLDKRLGVHLRRYYYSETLIDYPERVWPLYVRHLSPPKRLMYRAVWPGVRKLMIKGMDLGPAQGQASKAAVMEEISWLADLLEDGRKFLCGDQLTRADLTAASLLSALVLPEQHPTYADLFLSPNYQAEVARLESDPVICWVRGLYQHYR
ncbi:MAG: glutathione S-transferase N-terminal domain-containing protein [Motiliproteus sp.]|nr:glutathione S-transferase N-terminal domain-containing protein [Motiliproteus sp.]MCW9052813.1 glutathione S-transferase N-terminal domain-containing protein [Motiliproteus sp.]